MRLLIVTQSVDLDNPVLAFFHAWLLEFAKKCESLTVICLEEGRYELPGNVKVITLGKRVGSGGSSIIERAKYATLFRRLIRQERVNYDAVFVHMNPIYVVIGGNLWKSWGKPVYIWYTHRNVDLKLKLAEKRVAGIFTASKESFQLKSDKVSVVGHGIDWSLFGNVKHAKTLGIEPVRIIHVGRITKIKNCDTLIEAAHLLKQKWNKKFEILFIGGTVTDEDTKYLKFLEDKISEYSLKVEVKFIGSVTQHRMIEQYALADASVNLTPTGGVDKSVLESMATCTPVFCSNETFKDYFESYSGDFIFEERNAGDLAEKVMKFFGRNDILSIVESLQKVARQKTDIPALIGRMLLKMTESTKK